MIRDLHDWTAYAANDIQQITGRLLLRSSLLTYSNIVGGEAMARIVAASSQAAHLGDSRLRFPPVSVVNFIGDVINSQVQVGTVGSVQHKGSDR
jgi:hypothetical protein